MIDTPLLKEKYTLAKCCRPVPDQEIVGYFSHDDVIKIHRHGCSSLSKAETERLIVLQWKDILSETPAGPDDDYIDLDKTDFAVLKHHRDYDIDYSLMVAKILALPRQEAFDRHQKLRNLGLLERVDPVMIRYRKNTVRNKWIKHRNHTYYRLTEKGSRYLDFWLSAEHSA
jgi:hypothetical protein